VLDLGRYVDSSPASPGSKPLGELLALGKKIARGTTASAKKLDEVVIHGVGNMRYLTPANIDDGLINYASLSSLADLTQTVAWSLIDKPCVVVPRNGDPSKVAVVEPPKGQLICPSGNLYIIKVDPFLLDPYYLAAYLKSEDGAAELAKRTVGTTTKSISIRELNTLPVPMRSVEEQEHISSEYRELIDELAVLAVRVAGTKERITRIFTQGEVC
jgi:type I restriction enzyme M protein